MKKRKNVRVASAYVDGSFSQPKKVWGYGVVFLPDDDPEKIIQLRGSGTKYNRHWQIAGELYAATFASLFAIKNHYTDLAIYYDYQGVECWATGKWKRKTDLSVQYGLTMENYQRKLNITFHKVAAHTGVAFNEIADQLSKQACKETGKKQDAADVFIQANRKAGDWIW